MVDRIEELLSEMAAEEMDGEEQEDVLALDKSVDFPAFPRGDGGEAGEAETETDAETAPVEAERGRDGGRTAEEIASERPDAIAGETAAYGDGEAAQTLWKEGPVWWVRAAEPEVEAAEKLAAERVERTEGGLGTALGGVSPAGWAAQKTVEEPPEAAPAGKRRAGGGQTGLEGLYRQTVQGTRPAAPALPPEQAGRPVRAKEPGSAASLAVDELDRAVRRDSRRYDGGMAIF